MAKSASVTVRASAALPSSGAYDAGTGIDVPGSAKAEIYVAYTRGGSGGAFKMKISASPDGTNFYERTVIDGGSLSAGDMTVFTAGLKFPVASGTGAELRSFIVDLDTTVSFKVQFAEYGVTGTPGTLAAVAILAGR